MSENILIEFNPIFTYAYTNAEYDTRRVSPAAVSYYNNINDTPPVYARVEWRRCVLYSSVFAHVVRFNSLARLCIFVSDTAKS